MPSFLDARNIVPETMAMLSIQTFRCWVNKAGDGYRFLGMKKTLLLSLGQLSMDKSYNKKY